MQHIEKSVDISQHITAIYFKKQWYNMLHSVTGILIGIYKYQPVTMLKLILKHNIN